MSYVRSQSSGYITSPLVSKISHYESIDCIKQVRLEWEQGINEELMAIKQEQNRNFTIPRNIGVFNKYLAGELLRLDGKKGSSRSRNGGPNSVRFLFDSEDLLETGIGIRSLNTKPEVISEILGMIKLNLYTSSLNELQKKYSDLSPHLTQIGLDENLPAYGSKYLLSKHEEGEAIATYGK